MSQSDQELLLECRRGDETAWTALVKRYQKLVYAIPRRAGLDEDLAAEVFQEVFTTLFEKLDEIKQPERLQAWIVTTARRKTWRLLSREVISQRAWRVEEDQELEMLGLPDEAPLADDLLVQLEEQHRVRTALAELDERCQKLLTLLFYRETPPSYAEIAGAVGVPEGSIGPTRARCLKKLQQLLIK